MKAYVYQAALLCEACGVAKAAQRRPHMPEDFDPEDESTYDSDEYPKGPYGDGGGEADCPQHCDACDVFLENPLTGDGVAYVVETLIGDGVPGRSPLKEWTDYYGHPEIARALAQALGEVEE